MKFEKKKIAQAVSAHGIGYMQAIFLLFLAPLAGFIFYSAAINNDVYLHVSEAVLVSIFFFTTLMSCINHLYAQHIKKIWQLEKYIRQFQSEMLAFAVANVFISPIPRLLALFSRVVENSPLEVARPLPALPLAFRN